jgi:hypothetical protein
MIMATRTVYLIKNTTTGLYYTAEVPGGPRPAWVSRAAALRDGHTWRSKSGAELRMSQLLPVGRYVVEEAIVGEGGYL